MTGKTDGSLAAALEREHREIDEGIERFAAQPASDEARQALTAAIDTLRRHIYLEEACLFPGLQAQGAAGIAAPIFMMLREHAQIWHPLDDLDRELAAGATDGRQLCHQLLVQLKHHNLKEERTLYPEADRTLPPAAATRLAAFLESGHMPNGWICIKARES